MAHASKAIHPARHPLRGQWRPCENLSLKGEVMLRLVLLVLYLISPSSTAPAPDAGGGYDPDG